MLRRQEAAPSMHLRLIRSPLTFLQEIINFDIAEDISLWPRSQRAGCGLPVSGLYSAPRFDEWDWGESLSCITEGVKKSQTCFYCRNTGWCCISCKPGEHACQAPGSKSQKRPSGSRVWGLSWSPLKTHTDSCPLSTNLSLPQREYG